MIASGRMLRTRFHARAIAAALLFSAACGTTEVASPPSPTTPGTPTSEGTGGSVGTVGGSVTARGGGLVVAVPAGAIGSPLDITITEITNHAPHGTGTAYRLGPEGTKFSAPVALIFKVDPDVSVFDLGIATQDASGYWVKVPGVRRDPVAHTLVATTTHFSDWAVVPAPSTRDLSGVYNITSTRDGVTAHGISRLHFEDGSASASYYLQTGRITADSPITIPGATCSPTTATQDVGPNITEILSSPASFRWGASAVWDTACTTGTGSQVPGFSYVVFDSFGINYLQCGRSYLETPLIQTDEVRGRYRIDCGSQGTIDADWHFQRCYAGETCQTANPCKTAAISCDAGLPQCIENGNVTNGTVCDVNPTAPYEVCGDGVCNVCRLDSACTPTNPCHVGRITCDTGFEVCTDTLALVANGTTCDVNPTAPEVCYQGSCVACTAGVVCATNPNKCVAGTTSCATGQEVCVDTTTAIANGTTCGTNQVCFNSTCVACTAGTACATNPNKCVAGTTSCATGQEVCVDTATAIANGTTCGTNQVCYNSACVACTAGTACATNPNKCVAGTTSCATGQEVCVDTTTTIANGTTCGTDQVCFSGACTACTAGGACTTNANPCVTGAFSCATGQQTCENTATSIAAGTTCGTNQVCNGSGTCIACTASLACSTNANPCVAGTTSCSTGAQTCENTATNLPPGTACGTNQVCNGGTCTACTAGNACTTNPNKCVAGVTDCSTGSERCIDTTTIIANGTTCDVNPSVPEVCFNGTCSACTAGLACTANPSAACLTGVTSCSTGTETCVDSTPKTNGTICGTDLVCNGGSCVACAAGGACSSNPDAACHDGVFSCSTGTQACVDGAAKANGTTCGTNLVCNGGACSACTAGTACVGNPDPACHDGVTSCATGASACVDGAAKANGTTCGTNLVCSAGVCSACTASLACTTNPDPACHDGVTSCSTGTQTCIDGAAKTNGTTCGSNLVCNGGACSACTANAACNYNPSSACLTGITSCSTGSETCLDSTAKPNGTICGTDQVCNGGVCASCTAGLSCSTNPTPCILGVTSCLSGAQTCVDTSPAQAAPNGTTCDVNTSVPEVCLNGTCNACTAGSACSTNSNPCVTGVTSCATGQQTCENTTTPIANGTSCGTNLVCNAGACTACTAGTACTSNPGALCLTGVTSCSTGTSTCVDSTPKTDGTSCGTNMVCSGGVCGTCTAGLDCTTNPSPCLGGTTSCSTGTQACLDDPTKPKANGLVCGANQVCSGGVCSACTAGLSCSGNPNACLAGTTSCSTGTSTCVDSTTVLANGTSCGTNLFCSAGVCSPCTAGVACTTNPDPCLTGTTSCSTGTSTCVNTATAEPNGTLCGTNLVCNGGACTACTANQACATNPDRCRAGTTSCTTGTESCVDSATVLANGTTCGVNEVCNGGVCSTCTANLPCTTNPNPCVDGTTSCSTGTQSCVDTATPKSNGTTCGTNLVCNGGVCSSCVAGTDCTPAGACVVSQTSCSTGTQTCVATPTQLANGTTCGTNQVCSGGTCTACTAGAACSTNTNSCVAGTTSCSTGSQTCENSTTNLANGTSCGTNQVCNAGACVACAAGGACSTNPNPCVDGTESCATGALTCADTSTVKANGTSCGTDKVCSAGSCVACVAGAACTTNSNVCVAGVTSCATGSQTCENGTVATNEGAACGTDLVCKAGACLRVVTGTRLVTRWTTGAGCSVASPCQTTTVAPDVVSLTAQVEAIGPDGTRYPGSFSPSGSFSISGVPPGAYTLAFTDGAGVTHFYETSATSFDLGYDVLGREATAASAPTPVTLTVSGLSGWIDSDEVQLAAPDVDVWDAPISGTELVAGEVGGSVVEDWSSSSIGRALNLVGATDAVWVHQLATSTVTSGIRAFAYQAMTRYGATTFGADLTNGVAASLTAPLGTTTQTGTLTIDWRTSQFEALLASMGPGAQPAANPHALLVRTHPYALASPAPVAAGGVLELFRLVQPAATADVDLTALTPPIVYGRYLDPALWSESRVASFTARVSYTAPGAATSLDALATVSRREPMLPAPPSPIVPAVGPVQAPLVNGLDALGTLGAVGATPTIGWSAPLVGTPSSYGVTLRELYASGTASATRVVATWAVAGRSITLPAGLLVANRTYYVEITAFARTAEQFDTAPNRSSNVGSDATTLTSTFSP